MNRFEEFSLLIFDISKSWHKITSQEMNAYGLRGPHSMYLLALEKSPLGLSAPQLCEICDKNKADVSRSMAFLIKKGLALKKGENQNMYAGNYVLTKQGISIAKQIRKKTNLAVQIAGKDLDDESRKILYNSLSSISKNLKNITASSLNDIIKKEGND